MCAAIRSATGSAPRNFSAPTSSPRDALVGERRPRPRERRRAPPGTRARGASAARSAGTPAAATAARARTPRTAARPRAPAPARRRRTPGGATQRDHRQFTDPDHASCRDARREGCRRISTRSSQLCAVFAPNLLGAAVPVRCRVDIRPDRADRARGLPGDLRLRAGASRAPRAGRGRRRSASSCCGSRASLCLFVALVSPIDRLGEQFASFHMVQHLLLADLVPICLTLALTKHILRPVTRRIQLARAGGRAVRASRVRRRRLRRRRCGSGTSRSCTRPRSGTRSSTCSST